MFVYCFQRRRRLNQNCSIRRKTKARRRKNESTSKVSSTLMLARKGEISIFCIIVPLNRAQLSHALLNYCTTVVCNILWVFFVAALNTTSLLSLVSLFYISKSTFYYCFIFKFYFIVSRFVCSSLQRKLQFMTHRR